MALTIVKRFLSGSTDGLPIGPIGVTASNGTALHTGHTSTAVFDELYLYGGNTTTNNITVNIEWGTAGNLVDDIPPRTNLYPLVVGHPLWGRSAGGTVVRIYASSTAGVFIWGHVHRVTES